VFRIVRLSIYALLGTVFFVGSIWLEIGNLNVNNTLSLVGSALTVALALVTIFDGDSGRESQTTADYEQGRLEI
jgi:hypothetical protein